MGGVDLFFVLSGFLISGLLFKEAQRHGSISFKRFFIRRGFKIYPAFYCLLLATIIVELLKGHRLYIRALIIESIFLQDYLPGMWNHTWSLAVEEQFYVFLPILLMCLIYIRKSSNNPFGSIPYIFTVISITYLILRIITSSYLPYEFFTNKFPFHLRLDALFFGVLLSYYFHYFPEKFMMVVRRFDLMFLLLGLALLAPAFMFKENIIFIHTAGFVLFYVGSGFLLMAALNHGFKNNILARVLAKIGMYSYSIYLWHGTIVRWAVPFLEHRLLHYWNWYVYLLLYLSGSIGGGIVMSKIIEYPMLQMRERLFPSRSKLTM